MVNPPGKYAATVTVGEKGQIVIPKAARDLYGIKPGDTLLVLADQQQGIAIVNPAQFEHFINNVIPGVPSADDEDPGPR
ncbi:AbrB/MazE/SpoVT family DNA-binding domain-containing protein [Mariniluteicoccus flavus]